jgi:signal transduction histidine kinase
MHYKSGSDGDVHPPRILGRAAMLVTNPPSMPLASRKGATVGFIAVVVVTLALTGVILSHTMAETLLAQTDRDLGRSLQSIRQPTPESLNPQFLVLAVAADGHVTKRMSGASSLPGFPRLSPGVLAMYADGGKPVTVGSKPYRTVVEREPGGGYLLVATPVAATHGAVRRLLLKETLISLPLVCLLALAYLRAKRRERADRLKSERRMLDALATAGHELRTPLTAISGYVQLARLGGLAEAVTFDLVMARMTDETQRMTSLIDELLLLSRLELGQPLRRQSVDLAQLCRDAVADARASAPHRRIRLTIMPGNHTVTGDPHRLYQVVANLLANAHHHTPDGTHTQLGLGTEDGDRVIEILDNGPGIPPELRDRIFERFFHAKTSAGTLWEGSPGGGNGLGLSVVAAIVAAHGGVVALEPSTTGAWFRIRLPT